MNAMDEGIDQELRGEFIDESLDGLQRVSALLVELEANPRNLETVQAIFRPVHSIKGSSAFFGLLQTKALAHELETLLDLIRKGGLVAETDVIGVLLEGMDELTAMLQRTHRGELEAPDPQALAQLVERVRGFAGSERETEEGLWRGLFEAIADVGDPALTAKVQRVARGSVAGRKALDAGQVGPGQCGRAQGAGCRPGRRQTENRSLAGAREASGGPAFGCGGATRSRGGEEPA